MEELVKVNALIVLLHEGVEAAFDSVSHELRKQVIDTVGRPVPVKRPPHSLFHANFEFEAIVTAFLGGIAEVDEDPKGRRGYSTTVNETI